MFQRTGLSSVRSTRRGVLGGAAALAFGAAVAAPADARTKPTPTPPKLQRVVVRQWASDTWRSLVAMTDPRTGLPADNIPGSLDPASASRYTSPTNIGGYLWSAVVAKDLGIITPGECTRRVRQTLQTLLKTAHHPASGMYANWIDPRTGAVLRVWPDSGDPIVPFYSSVDNGWLGAALQVVRTAVPGAAKLANQLWTRMRWDMFYDPAERGGLIHGGFHDEDPSRSDVFTGNHIGVGPDVWYTRHHYDTCVSETRITTYLGIIRGQIPATNYYALWRTLPATCDWSWHESQPVGVTRTYFGMTVFEGAYVYRGMKIVPGWGGSMFEALMPDVFVPESTWAPKSWGVNHPLFVRAQREHGLDEAGYGYWGFSPSTNPAGGYREYGVDALGIKPDGYFSDQENTNYDIGFGDCRAGTNPKPTYGDGVVTPHAAFLAMQHEPDQAYANLVRIRDALGGYGRGGFYDAIATRSGQISRQHLSLDQAMIMGAIGNVIGRDLVRRAFSTREVERALRPVIGIEQFGAGLV